MARYQKKAVLQKLVLWKSDWTLEKNVAFPHFYSTLYGCHFPHEYVPWPIFGAAIFLVPQKIQVVSGETHSRIRKPWSSHTRLPTWRSEKTGVGYRVFRFAMEGCVYMQMYRNSPSLICNADLMSMLGDYDVWFLYYLFLFVLLFQWGWRKPRCTSMVRKPYLTRFIATKLQDFHGTW